MQSQILLILTVLVEVASEGDDPCAATTAYMFIAHKLPMWPLWEEYFRGCNGDFIFRIASTRGDLRFSFQMIDTMLDLIESLQKMATASNGCTPRWVHFASDSCAPLVPCSVVQHELRIGNAEHASFIDCSQNKSTQWLTLWMPHALTLARDRVRMKQLWQDNERIINKQRFVQLLSGELVLGALDEIVFPMEFRRQEMTCMDRNLIGIDWYGRKRTPFGAKRVGGRDHPLTWGYDIPAMLQRADYYVANRKFFLRKIIPEAWPNLMPRVLPNSTSVIETLSLNATLAWNTLLARMPLMKKRVDEVWKYVCSSNEYFDFLKSLPLVELDSLVPPAGSILLFYGTSYLFQIVLNVLLASADQIQTGSFIDICNMKRIDCNLFTTPSSCNKNEIMKFTLKNTAIVIIVKNCDVLQEKSAARNLHFFVKHWKFTHAFFMHPHPDCLFEYMRWQAGGHYTPEEKKQRQCVDFLEPEMDPELWRERWEVVNSSVGRAYEVEPWNNLKESIRSKGHAAPYETWIQTSPLVQRMPCRVKTCKPVRVGHQCNPGTLTLVARELMSRVRYDALSQS